MKKRLFWILTTLLWIFSFCSAEVCTQPLDYNLTYCPTNFWDYCSVNTKYFLSSYKFITDWVYSISWFSYFSPDYRSFSDSTELYVCLSNKLVGSVYFPEYVLDSSSNCINIWYTFQYWILSWNNFNTVNLNTPFVFDSSDFPYIFFVFLESSSIWYSYEFSRSFNYELNSDVFYTPISNSDWYYLVPRNICYSFLSVPKFKINYWNTSYEYELNDNLSIYLKSPVVQNWNTFTYDWSTWVNLFYNNTSQFYSKNKLYLNSMYWYNNNIFTPICL